MRHAQRDAGADEGVAGAGETGGVGAMRAACTVVNDIPDANIV